MGLAETVGELKGKKEPEVELKGEVQENGTIKLDTTDLDAVGKALKIVRKRMAADRKEEKRLKQLVLEHPDAKIGYANQFIHISGSKEMDVEDPQLLAALVRTKTLNRALNMTLSAPKIREIAETEPEVAKAITTSAARKVNIAK